jgi:Kef-type K+ transport system membrane component KefB
MTGLDYFAWIVLIVLLITAILIWIVLAMLPGKIAKQRNHPQADAINVSGWLGALMFGVFWPFALIWAFTKPFGPTPDSSSEIECLKTHIGDLEAKLASREENLL